MLLGLPVPSPPYGRCSLVYQYHSGNASNTWAARPTSDARAANRHFRVYSMLIPTLGCMCRLLCASCLHQTTPPAPFCQTMPLRSFSRSAFPLPPGSCHIPPTGIVVTVLRDVSRSCHIPPTGIVVTVLRDVTVPRVVTVLRDVSRSRAYCSAVMA